MTQRHRFFAAEILINVGFAVNPMILRYSAILCAYIICEINELLLAIRLGDEPHLMH